MSSVWLVRFMCPQWWACDLEGRGIMISLVQNFFMQVLWPWFKKHLWPVILKAVTAIALAAVTAIMDRVQQAASETFETLRTRAAAKAEEAAQQAVTSANPDEAEKHEAVAQVWREVAETQRLEKEELERRLAELTGKSLSGTRASYDALEPSAVITNASVLVAIADQRSALPLPEGPDGLGSE